MCFRIRLLNTLGEYREAERLQRRVWGFPDREIIPLNELVVAQENGGFVFGAFDARGRMAAFAFGVPALHRGRLCHYSRMLGVLARYRDSGLGFRMKRYQRKLVLRQGLDLIRWTVDPLQSRNANFNFRKLGAIAREYKVNLYGRSGSRFNAGLPTDRFVVEWHLRSAHVRRALLGRARPAEGHVPVLVEQDGRPVRIRAGGKRVSVELPADIDRLKARDRKLAMAWRITTRRTLTELFSGGYVVCGFATRRDGRRRRHFTLLERAFRVDA